MRWIPLIVLTYLLTLAQTSLVGIIDVHVPTVGVIRPELLIIVVVFTALHVRSVLDAMLTGWVLGLALDVTTGAGADASTVVGPMALAYALAGGGIYKIRGAVFREKVVTQCVMTVVFCLLSHWVWITVQWVLVFRGTTAKGYLVMLVQASLVGLYTAALAPAGHLALRSARRWIIASPAGDLRRRR